MTETNIETVKHLDGVLGKKFNRSLFCSAYPSFVALEFIGGGYTFSYNMGESFEDVSMNLSENDVIEILEMISRQIAIPAVNISLRNTKFNSEIWESRKELIASLMEGCHLNIEAVLTGDPEVNPVINSSDDSDGSQTIHFSNITTKEGVSDTYGLVSRLYNALIAENELDDLTFYIVEGYEPDFYRPNDQIFHRYILASSAQLDYGCFEKNSADGGCLHQSVFEELECLVIDPVLKRLFCIKPNSRNYRVMRLIAGPNIKEGERVQPAMKISDQFTIQTDIPIEIGWFKKNSAIYLVSLVIYKYDFSNYEITVQTKIEDAQGYDQGGITNYSMNDPLDFALFLYNNLNIQSSTFSIEGLLALLNMINNTLKI